MEKIIKKRLQPLQNDWDHFRKEVVVFFLIASFFEGLEAYGMIDYPGIEKTSPITILIGLLFVPVLFFVVVVSLAKNKRDI